jgi:Secretion system C-terminal sorting domain
LDYAFDGDGFLVVPIGAGHDNGTACVIQPDGKLLINGAVQNGSDYDFGVIRVNSDFIPLLVTLISFTVIKNNSVAELLWTTASEQNNKGFEIQRSSDGVNFIRIGWVDGVGNSSSLQNYSFTDAAPAKGKNFYRLNQVDIDNKSKLSAILKVDFTSPFNITVYPNPATNMLNVQVSKSVTAIKIFDAQGKLVWQQGNNTGLLSISVPVQKLTAGLYILEASDADGYKQVQKFIIKE